MYIPKYRVVVLTEALSEWFNGNTIVEAGSIEKLQSIFPRQYDTWQQDLMGIMCIDDVAKVRAIEFQQWNAEHETYVKIEDPRQRAPEPISVRSVLATL